MSAGTEQGMTTRTQETIRLAEWLDELERLAREATPGPWELSGDGRTVRYGDYPSDGPWGDERSTIGMYLEPGDAAYITAANPQAILALLAVARDVAINHRPYTTVGIETAICPCCSDLEAGEVVLWEDCPHRPAVDALIALVGSRA